MRRLALLVVFGLLLWACTGGGSPTSTVSSTSTGPQAAAASTTGTTVASSTTTTSPVWPQVEVLVSNDDGVFSIDATGEVMQLVKGRVAYAVDDTRGGLLFQVERGRSTVWASWQPDYGELPKDTRVWWVPRGEGEAQALLVPTPGAGHDLSLYDAYQGDDGHVQLVYVRSDTPEGRGSIEGYWGQTDSLRVLDVETGRVTVVWEQGAYEAGFGFVSAGGGLLAATGFEQVWWWCFFLDPAAASENGYDPMAGEDLTVDLPGAPPVDAACEDDESCELGCVLSADRGLLAYRDATEVTVLDRTSEERQRFEFIEDGGAMYWGALDLAGTHLLVNRQSEWDAPAERPAILVSLDSGERHPIPVAGLARFVTAPVDINAPVMPPTRAGIQLRADGLGLVGFGDPVEETVDLLVGVLGEPDRDETAAGEGVRYSRWLDWSSPQLSVAFNRMDVSRGGEFSETLRLTEWVYRGPGGDPGWVLETPEGVTVGATLTDLEEAYRDEWWVCTLQYEDGGISYQWMTTAGMPPSWQFWPPGSFGLSGWFDRSPEDPAARVEGLGAGWRMPDDVCPPPDVAEGGIR